MKKFVNIFNFSVFTALGFLILSGSLFAQSFNESKHKILILQDSRSLGDNRELVNYLKSGDQSIVRITLNALANIQDTTVVGDITGFLQNCSSTSLKLFGYGALGRLPCSASNKFLSEKLFSETDPFVLSAVLESLGRVGDENSLNLVFEFKSNNEDVLMAKSLSMARFALRNIKSEDAVTYLAGVTGSNLSDPVKIYAAYALYRTRNKDLLTQVHGELLSLTKNVNKYIRMWAFSALGYVADTGDVAYVISSLENEKEWKVKVNILNSLPLYKKTSESIVDEKLVNAITALYDDENPNAAHTALRITALLFSETLQPNKNLQTIKDRLEWFFPPDKAVDWQTKGEALLAYGTIFKEDVKNALLKKMSETENEDLAPYIIKSFQFFKDGNICRELTDSVRTIVQRYNKLKNQESGEMVQDATLANIYRAYVETLSVLKNKAGAEDRKYIFLVLTEFTGSKDPSILDFCFTGLNDKIYETDRKEIGMVLLLDYKELVYPKDKDAIIAFVNEFGELGDKDAVSILKENLKSINYDVCKASANALKKITGKEYTFKAKPKTDYDWDFIDKLNQKKYATITTNKGKIKFMMTPEVTPFTVQNFVKLAENKFYDNTVFHRIVPNFVIQGGDPLNNGYGGPEFSIRSEFSDFFFMTGAVGMASDGKDTEGSQFFIMHSPHFHLDGKYTLFGIVMEGQDVVDHIMPYDKIESITFSEN
jgi:cyclophilin family peptidyl-prolyl cis-trans isomerase/HEAT repeat protein